MLAVATPDVNASASAHASDRFDRHMNRNLTLS